MGYYTGNGETTSGGSSVSLMEAFVWFGAHNVYQRTTSTTNRRAGLSLATVQAARGELNMRTIQFTYGSAWHYAPNCAGTRSAVSFTQIGGSNLYELTTTSDTIEARLDDGNWRTS